MILLDWSPGNQVCPILIIPSRWTKKMWDYFSTAVWALVQSAMQPGAHLMFQSRARFSFGPHFSSVPAYTFWHVCVYMGLFHELLITGWLSWSPPALVAQFVAVFQRSAGTSLGTHHTLRWPIFLKSDKKWYLNKQKNPNQNPNPALEEQAAPCLACYDNSSFRSARFI